LEVSPNPLRDTIVVAFRLTGEDVTLYALLAPHLDGSGWHNNVRADGDLIA
jgi:glucoamylase